MTRFDKDTAITPLGDGRFSACLDPGWWIVKGPNGGYLTAILMRGILAEREEEQRLPRSLTVHFLAPAAAGSVELEVHRERVGGSLTTIQARMTQEGRSIATAVAALSKPRAPFELSETRMPEAPPPETLRQNVRNVPANERFDIRMLPGLEPFSGSKDPTIAGWIRLREPRPLDYPMLAAYTDSFSPALFAVLEDSQRVGVPTIDLTVHFHAVLPRAGDREDDYCLSIMHSKKSHQGFVMENAEIWSRDGQLLASARQLAAVVRG